MTASKARKIIVALTGASGIPYGVRLVETLAARENFTLSLMISNAAWKVALTEMRGLEAADPRQLFNLTDEQWDRVEIESVRNIGALSASGSSIADAMVIVPCSMKTLAAVAHGFEENLIIRAANCILKEGRSLVIVPRETPLHAIYLENMLNLARLGVRIVPAMPAFYHDPQSIGDLVDFIVMKICDQLGLETHESFRWKGLSE